MIPQGHFESLHRMVFAQPGRAIYAVMDGAMIDGLPGRLAQAAPEWMMAARERVVAGLTTTFASRYTGQVPLLRMLDRDVVAEYAKMRTGERVLIAPNG